jgi:hypothetical protein
MNLLLAAVHGSAIGLGCVKTPDESNDASRARRGFRVQ